MDLTQAHATIGATELTPIAEIQERYRLRARMLHPDRVGDSGDLLGEAHRAMSDLNEAWAVIQAAERTGERAQEGARSHESDSYRRAFRDPVEGECDLCGCYPASRLVLRATSGMLIMRQNSVSYLDLCHPCGISMFRTVQGRTMLTGWWTPIAAIVNIRYILGNWIRARSHQKMPLPQGRDAFVRTPFEPPLPLAKPISHRIASLIATTWAMGVVLALGGLVVAGLMNPGSATSPPADSPSDSATPETSMGEDAIGVCLTPTGAPVACFSEDARFRIVLEVRSPGLCGGLAVFESARGDLYCAELIG